MALWSAVNRTYKTYKTYRTYILLTSSDTSEAQGTWRCHLRF